MDEEKKRILYYSSTSSLNIQRKPHLATCCARGPVLEKRVTPVTPLVSIAYRGTEIAEFAGNVNLTECPRPLPSVLLFGPEARPLAEFYYLCEGDFEFVQSLVFDGV